LPLAHHQELLSRRRKQPIPDELRLMFAGLDLGDLEDIAETRYRWGMLCEASIWSQLYHNKLENATAVDSSKKWEPLEPFRWLSYFPKGPVQGGVLHCFGGIDQKLVDYRVRTFLPYVLAERETLPMCREPLSENQGSGRWLSSFWALEMHLMPRKGQMHKQWTRGTTVHFHVPCFSRLFEGVWSRCSTEISSWERPRTTRTSL
jgi:hypothetical protein